jgi:hypothetical protein
VTAREAALEAKQRGRAQAWEVEDEARQLEAQHKAARRQKLAQQAEAAAAQEAAAHLVLAHELEAEEALCKVGGGVRWAVGGGVVGWGGVGWGGGGVVHGQGASAAALLPVVHLHAAGAAW